MEIDGFNFEYCVDNKRIIRTCKFENEKIPRVKLSTPDRVLQSKV